MVATKRRFDVNLQKIRILLTARRSAPTSAPAASRAAGCRRPCDGAPALGPRPRPAARSSTAGGTQAAEAGVDTSVVVLATATAAGQPAARMVLVKGFDDGVFRFFTNYESRKAIELAENPRAALLFHWPGRQVRIEGAVARLPAAESDAYFDTRPPGSRLSAAVSPQSRPVRVPRGARGGRRAPPPAVPRRRRPPPAELGRIPARPAHVRVLAARPAPDARPLPLHERGRRLGRRAARALKHVADASDVGREHRSGQTAVEPAVERPHRTTRR